MAIGMLQKAVSYIKDLQDVGLFGVMADSRLFAAFGGSPFFYVMLPFIAILLTVLAIINGYQLLFAENKNLDKWLGFIVSGICAVCASVSLYGAVISTALGITFAAGPWFFFSSVVLAAVHQGFMLGINAYRAFESLAGTSQRVHYIQAAISNAYLLGLLTTIAGAVTFVMLTPVAPVLGSVCAITTVGLIILNGLWRITPYNWKLSIKGFFHLGKPEIMNEEQLNLVVRPMINANLQNTIIHSTHRLFTQCDYSAVIKSLELNVANQYIKNIIARKIEFYNADSTPKCEKNIQKADLLLQLSTQLDEKSLISKNDLLKRYPLAFQSFWTEKGEVEQIFDAVMVLLEKYEHALTLEDDQQNQLTPAAY